MRLNVEEKENITKFYSTCAGIFITPIRTMLHTVTPMPFGNASKSLFAGLVTLHTWFWITTYILL